MANLYELLCPLLTCDTESEQKQSSTKTPPQPSQDHQSITEPETNKRTTEPKSRAKTEKKDKKSPSKQSISKTLKKQKQKQKQKQKRPSKTESEVTPKNFLKKLA